MPATLNPYLTFNGNCRKAMHFYKDCFGGELLIQTVAESPLAKTFWGATYGSLIDRYGKYCAFNYEEGT